MMPRYRYSAYDAAGRLQRGEAEATSLPAFLTGLHGQGLYPFETGEVAGAARLPWWQRDLTGPRGLSQSSLRLLTRELATLIGAEIPLDEALRLVLLQAPAGKTRHAVEAVLARVLDGDSLSKAMQGEPGMFPDHYLSMLAAGEASGSLGAVLEDLAQYLDRTGELKARITSALIYPAVLMVMAIVAVTLILLALVPALEPVFADAGTPPPVAFQVFAGLSWLMAAYWPHLALGAAAAAVLLWALLHNPAVAAGLDRLVLRLPIAGTLVTGLEVGRFARSLATLIRSGVPMLSALHICRGLARNRAFADAIGQALEHVKEGSALARPLEESGRVPALALRLVSAGEETGQLERMLSHVAQIYEIDTGRRIDRLMSLLTPALTLAIGLIVGGLILSVMNAVLSVNEVAFQ